MQGRLLPNTTTTPESFGLQCSDIAHRHQASPCASESRAITAAFTNNLSHPRLKMSVFFPLISTNAALYLITSSFWVSNSSLEWFYHNSTGIDR
jgi:hypothetical protein